MSSRQAIKAELEQLKSGGVIRPADVVNRARDPESALHPCFTWDDGEAAEQFRLLEARKLLQVFVVTTPADDAKVRAFVSLTADRSAPGGGYRAIADVMSDEQLQAQMLHDAMKQLRTVQEKYKGLRQLQKVWEAIDEADREESIAA